MRPRVLALAALILLPAVAALPGPLPLAGLTVVVDPGHGGTDSGARSYYATRGEPCPWAECPDEKDLNLRVATLAAALLRAHGASVVLTRSSDRTVSLAERVRVANDASADLFVSVHHNACCGGRGTESFYWGHGATFSAPGKSLASAIQREVVSNLGTHDRGVHADKDWLGYHLFVLDRTRMPAALVEVAFLDHKPDYDRVVLPHYQVLAAEGVAAGVVRHAS